MRIRLSRPEDVSKVIAVLIFGVLVFTGGFIYGAWRARAAVQPIVISENERVKFCQPFQTRAVIEAENYYLRRGGYTVVLDQDLLAAFKARSAGRADLIQQTRERCFTHLGHDGYAVNQYWMKTLRKR